MPLDLLAAGCFVRELLRRVARVMTVLSLVLMYICRFVCLLVYCFVGWLVDGGTGAIMSCR